MTSVTRTVLTPRARAGEGRIHATHIRYNVPPGLSVYLRDVQREKRQHLRAPFDAPVSVSGAYTAEVRARDISIGGMYLALEAEVPPPLVGAEVTLSFDLPGLERVHIPAFVRWLHADGFGVQFGLVGARITHAIGKLTLRTA